MFTPQKVWSGWSLTPKTGAQKSGYGSGLNQKSDASNSNSGDGIVAKGKGVAFGEAATPPSGLVVENGGKLLVGSGDVPTDREGLAKRISELENEVGCIFVLYLSFYDVAYISSFLFIFFLTWF